MSGTDDRYQLALTRQVDELIEAESDWITLANELDVDRYKHQDTCPEWTSSTPFRPLFLSYLWATVEDHPLTGIPGRLEDRPKLARAFGFDPDNLPSESTCKPVRLEGRFENPQSVVESAADDIQSIAIEHGAPIGCDLLKQQNKDTTDDPPSNRTVQRLLRKKGRDVLEELKQSIIPSISIPRPDDAIYDEEELLVLESIAAIKQSAANNAGTTHGDMKNPDPDLDDPFYEDGPSGETLLESMKNMSVDQISTVMNFGLRKTYTRVKPRLNELEHQKGSRFGTRAKIALDITYVAYYGDRDELVWVQGAPDGKEYDWCHKFATAVIVGDNSHYIVGVCPLGSTEYADTGAYAGDEKSYYVGDVARRLLSIAEKYVNIRMVYADREFHAADVIYTLESKDLKYVSCPRVNSWACQWDPRVSRPRLKAPRPSLSNEGLSQVALAGSRRDSFVVP